MSVGIHTRAFAQGVLQVLDQLDTVSVVHNEP